jgi:hypothetical protein
MTARYALMKLCPEPVEQDAFARAFSGVPSLTPVDAQLVGHDSGMLIRNVSLQQATALQSNLKAAGTEIEIVAEMALPVLPEAKSIRSLECSAGALTIWLLWRESTRISANAG